MHDRWLALVACVVLTSCGVNGPAKAGHVAEASARLELAPQISPDFDVNHPVPDFDPNAALVGITGGALGGYLLTYSVLRAPDSSSRIDLVSHLPSPSWTEVVFVRLDPTGGSPTTLARFPGSVRSLRAIEADTGWLIAYDESVDSGFTRHSRMLGYDGNLGPPKDLPLGSCSWSGNNLAGFARAGSTALLTDACGAGYLLDLTGGVLATLTIATPSSFASPPVTGNVFGGQVAFNGIDYLVTYGLLGVFGPTSTARQELGFPVTPAGAVASPIVIATPAAQSGGGGTFPAGVVASGGTFLALQLEPRASTSDYSYRLITEAPDHTFTLGAERYLTGGPNASPAIPGDLQAIPLTLNGHFAIARLPQTRSMQLVYPSTDPALPDASQPLPVAMTSDFHAPAPGVCTDSQGSDGKRLLFVSNTQAVRFDDGLQLIDDPPATLLSLQHGQFMPSFAFAAGRFLATWTEGVPNGLGYVGGYTTQVFAQHLGPTGAILDSSSLRLNATGTTSQTTANPSWFAVTWGDTSGGAVTLTTADPPVLTAFREPSGVSHGWGIGTDGEHLVTAFDNHGDIALIQFDSQNPAPTALTVAASIADSTVTPPALAFNNGQYAVLWTVAGEPDERVIYGARVSAGLELLDDPPKELVHFSSPDIPDRPGHPADCGLELIPSGDHFLLAWADVAGSVEELRIARLSSTLALLDPAGVLVSTQPYPLPAFNRHHVALGWDGSNDWVVWNDGEGGARSPLASVRGRRFSDSLAPVDADPFLISSDVDNNSRVTLAVSTEGRSLVGYTRYLLSDNSQRVRARFLSSAAFADGLPCGSASQCQSGYCVANQCSLVSGAGGSGGTESGSAGTGGIGGPAGGDTGGTSLGGSDGGGGGSGAGGAQAGGSAGDSDTGGVAVGGGIADGGTESGGEAANGAGASQGGARPEGGGGASGAGAGHAGAAGATAGSGGGVKEHSCSVRAAGSGPASENLVSLAGLATALCYLRRRRFRGVVRR